MSQLVPITIVCAGLVSACLVPIVRAIFRRLGIVDKPDRERKLHANAVSLGGGLAVFVSVMITFVLVLFGDRYFGDGILRADSGEGSWATQWIVLFAAAGVLMVVGLLDDAIALRGRQKLLLQVLVVVSIVGSGTLVQSIQWFG